MAYTPLREETPAKPDNRDLQAWWDDVKASGQVGSGKVAPLRPGYALERDEWISPAIWQGLVPPRRNWMVEGCFPAANVCMVSGDGGIGKTILLLQLCAAAASGRPWLDLSVTRGRSIYFACEDDRDELWRRMYDVAAGLGVDLADIGENMLLRSRVGQDNFLIEFEYGKPVKTDLWESLVTRCKAFGATYVVIDTASQTFRGNQSNETQVIAYINQLRQLAIAIQGVVIITKHPSMSGRANGTGMSGNVQWESSVRSRLYFKKNKEGVRMLEGVKNNYGLPMQPVSLKYHFGVFVKDEAARLPYKD